MCPKLLFIVGIIAAHGALAAGWVHQDAPKPRTSISTCIQAPDSLPHFASPRELLARTDASFVDVGVLQP
jgi:hypothetical protein